MSDNSRHFWSKLRKQANRTLGDQFWQDISGLLPNQQPRVDMYRTDVKLYVLIELPGHKAEQSLKLSIQQHTLHIKGDLPYPYPVEEEELLISERYFGVFHRKIDLPPDTSPQGIEAKFENGLLTVVCRRAKAFDSAVDIPIKTAPLAERGQDEQGDDELGSDPIHIDHD